MKECTNHQNEMLGKLFSEIKKRKPVYRSEALAMLGLNDENFTRLYIDIDNEIVGDEEDIKLCHDRAKHLNLKK